MNKLSSKIFIDGGDPGETRQATGIVSVHFGAPLDGQTTNPTLIARNLKARVEASGERLTEKSALDEYLRIVQDIGGILPHGSISIQVFADEQTSRDDMVVQARQRNTWIPNASIKFPCTLAGLGAANIICQEMPVNITLVFSQSQAAAVYEATRDAKFPVFISPFVGRLDDLGENGMQVVANMLEMYKKGDGHVEVLTASVRNIEHILYALHLRSQIITIPFKVFKDWAGAGFPQPDAGYSYPAEQFRPIAYRTDITLGQPWDSYDLSHELTTKGLAAFWNDWNGLFIG